MYWLLLKPSHWRAFVGQMSPPLEPNFTIFDTTLAHRRDRRVLDLLAASILAVTFWVAAVVGLALAIMMQPLENVVFGMALGMGVGLASAFVADFTIGVAAGIVGGFAGGVAGGIGYGLAGVNSLAGIFAHGTPAVISLGLASCLGLGSTGMTVDALSGESTRQSWGQSVGILMFSILCDAAYALLFLAGYVFTGGQVRGFAFGALLVSMVGIGFGIIVGVLNRKWKPGVLLCVVFIVVTSVAVTSVNQIESRSRIGSNLPSPRDLSPLSRPDIATRLISDAYRGWAAGAADAMIICVVYALPYVPARFAAGSRRAARAGLLGAGGIYFIFSAFIANSPLPVAVAAALGSSLVGLTLPFWRGVALYPIEATWNLFVLRIDERQLTSLPSMLRWNAAFWDELQIFPQVGLEEHILLETERTGIDAREAREELLASGHASIVRQAEIELEARRLERCSEIDAIPGSLEDLTPAQEEGPAGSVLLRLKSVSQEIAVALNQIGAGNRRLTLTGVLDQIDKLADELSRFSDASPRDGAGFATNYLRGWVRAHERLDSDSAVGRRFHPIAMSWRRIVAEQRNLEEASQKQDVPNPYVVAVPLSSQHELFVGRSREARLIETQVLDHNKCPVLLYGQRRMGKTSLLLNLGKLFPSHIVPVFIDLQGRNESARSYGRFLYNVAREMTRSINKRVASTITHPMQESLESDPNATFDEWLDIIEGAIEGKTVLLEFDEFEVLERAIANGRFRAEEVLGMFRHIIQHRSNVNMIFCSSHSLRELQNLSAHLINVQVLKIGELTEAEALQLITRPVINFRLVYQGDASQRVLEITRGHPALVQLLCYNIVALKNEQDADERWTASLADVETALVRALQQGALIFSSIQKDVGSDGTACLRSIAQRGEGAIVPQEQLVREFSEELGETLALLVSRDLIERVDAGLRFRVEMIRRWFALPHVD